MKVDRGSYGAACGVALFPAFVHVSHSAWPTRLDFAVRAHIAWNCFKNMQGRRLADPQLLSMFSRHRAHKPVD